ncbi:MAG TPA: VCBS repeat-containing protein [Coriobacteriia bacterium]|nr:VCBS repeat-containing protein [Coriobacteriia bacterium]
MFGLVVAGVMLALLIGSLALPTAGFGLEPFLSAKHYTTGARPLCAEPADVDADGDLDLLVAEAGQRTVCVMRNDGAGRFSRKTVSSSSRKPVWIDAVDLNGDTFVDFAVADESARKVRVLINDRNGGFGGERTFSFPGPPNTAALKDVTGDGDVDLLVVTTDRYEPDGYGFVWVLPGDGSGGFGTARSYGVGRTPRSLAVGDLDGDGDLDLATANYYGENTAGAARCVVLTNNGSGYFGIGATPSTGKGSVWVSSGDVDGDGDLDLVVPSVTWGSVNVLENDGRAGLSGFATPGGFEEPRHAVVSDINGDGRQDLVVASYEGDSLSTMLGTGSGYGSLYSYPVGLGPWSFALADFDGDRVADIAVANRNSGNISILAARSDAKYTAAGCWSSKTTVNYGGRVAVYARLKSDGRALTGRSVVFERLTSKGWRQVATKTTSSTGLAKITVEPTTKTTYRARFDGEAGYRSRTSTTKTIKVRAAVGTPRIASSVRSGRSFTLYGYLKPQHSSGGHSVRLHFYHKEGSRYVLRKKVWATNKHYRSFTRYADRTSLKTRGRWRVRAYHADSGHSAKFSSYDYFQVK